MKNPYTLFLVGVVLLASCTKNETPAPPPPSEPSFKLKTIVSSNDTVYLLCNACPPAISRNSEHFVYDNLDRLSSRILITTRLSANPIITDTSEIFTYSYAGNSTTITAYSHTRYGTTAFHVLSYDSQNRLIRDSITNPEVGNNKLTRFSYLPNAIIEYEQQTFITGTLIKIDTMIVSGSDIIKEKISGFGAREITYTLSAYRNPLSYANNFSLFASDHKNGSNSTTFLIYNPQYITYHLTTQLLVTASSSYTTSFGVTLDALNRVTSITTSSNNNKTTSFDYY